MKTHEERMAEIYRRGDAIVKERKKRRNIFAAVCVPLVLCFIVAGAWLLPKGSTTESGSPEEGATPEIAVQETYPETLALTQPAVSVETVTFLNHYTDYPGVTVEILSVEETDGKTSLRVLWKNKTEKEMIYGSSFFVDSWQGDHWQSCQVNEDLVFTAIAYFLQPGEEREESYTLTGVYALPEEGTCRFRTECFVYETPEESLHCELWSTFDLKEGGTK